MTGPLANFIFMRIIRVSLVDLPEFVVETARTAAHEVFPGAEIVEITADELMRREAGPGLELLVLAESLSVSLTPIIQAVDEAGLPRWAAIILGGTLSELADTVPPEEWQHRPLARAFRSALLQHELLCENLRLRGDLRTVARRFSHDLITPVGCINTSACVLRIMPPEETQSVAAIIQNIEDSSTEISRLIERVSFVLRASADPGVPVEFEMGEVVAAVLKELQPDIRKAGAVLLLPSSWPRTRGVPKSLQVIWWNLLSNALKYGGSSVRIQLAWRSEDGWLRFSVSDNGAGVLPAMRLGLFRPFDQLHVGHTAGLGLAIVQRLIALQGGRCGYENMPEGGAGFYFFLPTSVS